MLDDDTAPEVHVLRCINATFFSEAFLVGGEGELREAELRIECWILLSLVEVSSAQRLDLTAIYFTVFRESDAGARAANIVVNFDWSGGNNTTNRCSFERRFQRWLYHILVNFGPLL